MNISGVASKGSSENMCGHYGSKVILQVEIRNLTCRNGDTPPKNWNETPGHLPLVGDSGLDFEGVDRTRDTFHSKQF